MTAIAPIEITDGTTAVTFTPVAVLPAAVYKDQHDSSVPVIGQPTIRIQVTDGKNGTSANRTRLTLELPIMETPAGGTGSGFVAAPAVAHTVAFVADIWSSKRASPNNLGWVRRYFIDLLSDPQVIDAIENRTPPL